MIRLTEVDNLAVDIDLEADILDGAQVILNDEIERGSFERTVPDVTFKVRNQNRQYSSLFSQRPLQIAWRVKIVDETGVAFFGVVKKDTIKFDPKKETCEFTAFSIMKEFWDRAKTTQVNNLPNVTALEPGYLFATLDYMMRREFLQSYHTSRTGTRLPRYGDLFTQIDIHPRFKNRNIRAWADCVAAGRADVGNNGRYRELGGQPYYATGIRQIGYTRPLPPRPHETTAAQRTTHYDLLTAHMVYYNAEFNIDTATGTLQMRPRNEIVNAIPANGDAHDISGAVLDSERIEVDVLDDDKADYIRYLRVVPRPLTPQFNSRIAYSNNSHVRKDFSLIVTEYALQADGSVIESLPSAQLDVKIAQDLSLFGPSSFDVNVAIPHVAGTTVYAKLVYRSFVSLGGVVKWYIIAYYQNVTAFQYLTISNDVIPPTAPKQFLSSSAGAYAAWLGYIEQTGEWTAPIYDIQDGKNMPQGRIIDVVPTLRFSSIVSPKGDLLPENLVDTAAFYGLEQGTADYDALVKTEFIAEMRTRSHMSCTAEGVIYRVGDAVKPPLNIAPELASAKMFVKRRGTDYNPRARTSYLELIQEVKA